ncbi:retinoblastoma-like protein 2 [Sabethes cyaneus]|uniref:retinoblastoma-like protein 2 n=1 Tax=Sabethes cyaneus TaxID=53552 RepID=UPI00237E242E|nr:retinoblastoma-like protein 2 [Sabethes cyaneus]
MTNLNDYDALLGEHRGICEQLNIDAPTEERSWNSFREISSKYKLDGDQMHWMCCPLYVTCRQAVTPTVGNTNSLRGNCVSLTRLLRLCNISLNEFFKKINQWAKMASLPEEQRNDIMQLQHRFAVSMSIYGKFRKVFEEIFLTPNMEEQKRGKKTKPQRCSSNRLYEFCWTLFICAKAEYPEQSGDLVTSYSMLLCCLDLIYANAIAESRKDIVNPSFAGLPKGFLDSGNAAEQPVCIIDAINEDGCASDALNTKTTSWKDVIEKLFQTNILKGDASSFLGLISVANFEENLKSLNNLYDTFILSCGEFDERIALGQKALEQPLSSRSKNEPTTSSATPEKVPLCQQTPLSGRSRIGSNECNNFTPISIAYASVNKLRSKLMGYEGKPQLSLQELFKSCSSDPTNILQDRVITARKRFMQQTKKLNWNENYTTDKCNLIEALYFKLLENIIRAELKRNPTVNMKEFCNEDMFNKSLLACSAEIVIFAHNMQQNLPWILDIFEMRPFFFYRIIELVVLNHNDILTRDIIKQLTSIEEQCVESLCWTSSSPLWTTMLKINYRVPSSQAVASSADLSGITPHKPGNGTAKLESTPSTSSKAAASGVAGAPEQKVRNPDSARKNLFKALDGDSKPAAPESDDSAGEKKGPTKESTGARANLNQLLGFNSPLKVPVQNGSLSKRKPGESSMNLFFRKFYIVAAFRMRHLCANLALNQPEIQKQIWTIFEYSITVDLMKDRHLDQMLMCAIYVFVKIKKMDITFTDIMKYYRNQPQSSSHVYRSVFIKRRTLDEANEHRQQTEADSKRDGERSHRVAPDDLAITSVQHESEERGDIIQFYNTVYVKSMQEFAVMFGNADVEHNLLLSPLPKTPNRNLMLSPKHVGGRYPVYITRMDRTLQQSPNSITYNIGRSTTESLDTINRIVGSTAKRSLSHPDSYEDEIAPMPTANLYKRSKMDKLISDRQEQESNVNND